MKEFLKKIIPRKVITTIFFYRIFNKEYGHSNLINGFIHDGYNKPLPWLTYPCVEFLNRLNLSDCSVFEFGSGSSTLYWSKKSQTVMSVEKDRSWFDKVNSVLPPNCTLSHEAADNDYINFINQHENKFDIIVLDGAVRYPCAEEALKNISDRGVIILDNTEWYPNTAKLLTSAGYTQIDFPGFPPLNTVTSATSIFFRSNELLSSKLDEHHWAPMGGRYLDAYDDKAIGEIDEQFLQK